MGRPTELDDLKAKRILDAIRNGNTRSCAARLAGINPDTLYTWQAKGRKGVPRYAEFAERLMQADAEAEDKKVTAIQVAIESGAPGTWKAAFEWLRIRRPKTWTAPEGDREPDMSAVEDERLWQAVEGLRKVENK